MEKDEIMEALLKKVSEDKDKQVFVLTIQDIIECIVDTYDEDVLSFSDEELSFIIERGERAAEWIDWSTTISCGLPWHTKEEL